MFDLLGLWIDLAAAGQLLSWLTLPAALLHMELRELFTTAATNPLLKRTRLSVLRISARDAARRRVRVTVILAPMVVMTTVSGALQGPEFAVGPMTGLHAATSFALFILAGWHVWVRRRMLRARRRSASDQPFGVPA